MPFGKNRRYQFVILLVLLLNVTGLQSSLSQENTRSIRFKKNVETVKKMLHAQSGLSDKMDIPAFLYHVDFSLLLHTKDPAILDMIKHPELYRNDFIHYISDKEENWSYRYAMIIFFQRLCIRDYVQVIQTYYTSLHNEGKLKLGYKTSFDERPYQQMLSIIINQDELEVSVEVYKNYKDPGLIKLLGQIKRDPATITLLKDNITRILNGTEWADYQDDYLRPKNRLWYCGK